MAKTHKEKDDQIKELKEEIRQLRGEVKSTTAEVSELHSDAHGIVIKDGHFNLVSIKFDTDTNKAAIEKVDDLGKSLALAASKVKHAVIDRLVEINKRRNQ